MQLIEITCFDNFPETKIKQKTSHTHTQGICTFPVRFWYRCTNFQGKTVLWTSLSYTRAIWIVLQIAYSAMFSLLTVLAYFSLYCRDTWPFFVQFGEFSESLRIKFPFLYKFVHVRLAESCSFLTPCSYVQMELRLALGLVWITALGCCLGWCLLSSRLAVLRPAFYYYQAPTSSGGEFAIFLGELIVLHVWAYV